MGLLFSRNYERIFAQTKSIRQVQEIIQKYKLKVEGSQTTYDAEQLVQIITDLLEGKKPLAHITRTYNVRVMVAKHIQKLEPLRSELLRSQKAFWNVSPEKKQNFSWWKIHVYTETIEDVILYYQQIKHMLDFYHCPHKLATQKFFSSIQKSDAMKKQRGKGITIYLPFALIQSQDYVKLVQKLQKITPIIEKKTSIFGDRKISDVLYYRYDVSVPLANFPGGLTHEEARKYYRISKTASEHNIPHNTDIFR
ncbi:MAG: hypothetical protein ACMXYA_02660 [Candidatus Woesearchaeota archaeon]